MEEIYRLLQIESENLEIYQLSPEQRKTISEAKRQINEVEILTKEEANSEIDSWLNG